MRTRYLLLALVLLAGLAGAFAWLVLTPAPALLEGPLIVEIPAHQGLREIADRLGEAGVIRSRLSFVGLVALKGSMRKLKAGEYEIPRDASTLDVLELIESGRVRQHAVLHPEGATVSELARLLENERLARAEDVIKAASSEKLRQALGIEGPSLEGYLFPDTYQFVRGMSVDEMLSRMVQRMRGKLTPAVQAQARERGLTVHQLLTLVRGLTVHQLLTLASIIEREAVDASEQKLISAVFWNRLKLDMPLQADPTVQYAVARERGKLTRNDLASDNPYNTYVHRGLPPGPIASPGQGAIAAALDPAPVKFLYFVARDDRRHYFSTTVAEHNAAVARYRLSRRQL